MKLSSNFIFPINCTKPRAVTCVGIIITARINVNNTNTTNEDIIIRALKQPTCIKAKEDGNIINIEIEKELGIEVIGDTFVKVNSVEEEDTWDILENNEEINTEYIKPTHEEEK